MTTDSPLVCVVGEGLEVRQDFLEALGRIASMDRARPIQVFAMGGRLYWEPWHGDMLEWGGPPEGLT